MLGSCSSHVFPSDTALRLRFGVQKGVDVVLVFKEGPKPVASLSMVDIPHNLMKDLLQNNKFLILPRLSSQVRIFIRKFRKRNLTNSPLLQSVMDAICPTETSIYRRRLCVLLIDGGTSVEHQNGLRKFAISWDHPRVRFAYVFPDRQRDFITSLGSGNLLNFEVCSVYVKS